MYQERIFSLFSLYIYIYIYIYIYKRVYIILRSCIIIQGIYYYTMHIYTLYGTYIILQRNNSI